MPSPDIFKRYECYIEWRCTPGDLRPYNALERLKVPGDLIFRLPDDERMCTGLVVVNIRGMQKADVRRFALRVIKTLRRYESVTIVG